jgi:hypothetical protein
MPKNLFLPHRHHHVLKVLNKVSKLRKDRLIIDRAGAYQSLRGTNIVLLLLIRKSIMPLTPYKVKQLQ